MRADQQLASRSQLKMILFTKLYWVIANEYVN